jgi:hypothetical protein
VYVYLRIFDTLCLCMDTAVYGCATFRRCMDMDMYGFATFRRCMDMDMDMLVYVDIYCLCMCDFI